MDSSFENSSPKQGHKGDQRSVRFIPGAAFKKFVGSDDVDGMLGLREEEAPFEGETIE
jgi:hypothetical protein